MMKLRSLHCIALALSTFCLALTPAQAAEFTPENPLIIKMTSFAMPTHPVVKDGFIPWGEELKEKSGGRMILELYNPNTICPDADVYDCVKSGVIDMGAQVTQRVKGALPLSNIIDMPMMYPSAEVASKVFCQLLEEFPELRAEYKDTKLFGGWSGAQFQFHTVKNPIHNISDASGLKIGAISASIVPIIQSLGSAAVSVPMSDCYLSLQRGQVDAIVCPYAFVVSTKIYEATNYSTTANLMGNGVYMCMNRDIYQSMPDDLRAILDETLNRERFELWGKVTDLGALNDIETIKKAGQQIFELSAEDIARGRELTRPVVDEWFADCEKRGQGDVARKLYARATELVEQYSAR